MHHDEPIEPNRNDELDPSVRFGPQGVHVAALIERAGTLTPTEARALYAARSAARGAARYAARYAAGSAGRDVGRPVAWYAARDAAWRAAWRAARGAALYAARSAARSAARDAARDAAWPAARYAAWEAAWYAAGDAAWGLVCRDLISTEHYDVLTRWWRTTVGPIHPDDPPLTHDKKEIR